MQVCGFCANTRIDDEPNNVFHVSSRINSTWGGNLTDMVRATHVLEIIERDNLVDNARTQGELLLGRLHELAGEFRDLVSQVRGRGLMIAFDLPDQAQRNQLVVAARERSLLLLPCGEKSIRFRPYLDLNRDDAEKAMGLLADSLLAMRRPYAGKAAETATK